MAEFRSTDFVAGPSCSLRRCGKKIGSPRRVTPTRISDAKRTLHAEFPYFSSPMPHQHIDLSTLNDLFKGNRARVEEWIQLYLEEAPGYRARLEACLADGDAPGLSGLAHELRPQAHYLGSPRMLELLERIGQLAKTEGASACAGPVAELLELGPRITAELNTEVRRG